MKSRSIHLWSVVLVTLALLLSACGAGNSGGTSTAPTAAPAAPAATDAPAAPEATAEPAAPAATDAPAAAASGGEINISLSADPPRLDPAFSSALVDRQVLHNICDKLVDIDSNGTIVPQLASEWTISEDNLSYTFTLREGVTFHDGTPLDAEAVAYNIERGRGETSARRNELSSIASVEVVDPQTITITLTEPFAPFLSILIDRAGMIVSPTAAEALGEDFANAPVCAGPFKFDSRIKDTSVTLVKNENYWQEGLPKLDKVTYKIFTDPNVAIVNLRSGQVDMTDAVPSKEVPLLQADANFTIVNEAGFGYQGFYLNTQQPPLDNPNVRKAIDILIDREALVRVVFGETALPGHSPFAPSHFAYGESDSFEAPDVEAAKALLAEAGVSDVSFTFKTGTAAVSVQVAQLIQSFLQPAGITMEIEQLDFATLLEQGDNGDFQALALGWSGRPDPDQNLYAFVVTDGANNDSRYSNATVDEKLNEARVNLDEETRKAAYDTIMEILHEEVPYVYLYHQNNTFAMTADVSGFSYVPDGIIRALELSK